jgi:hypothetical protein
MLGFGKAVWELVAGLMPPWQFQSDSSLCNFAHLVEASFLLVSSQLIHDDIPTWLVNESEMMDSVDELMSALYCGRTHLRESVLDPTLISLSLVLCACSYIETAIASLTFPMWHFLLHSDGDTTQELHLQRLVSGISLWLDPPELVVSAIKSGNSERSVAETTRCSDIFENGTR